MSDGRGEGRRGGRSMYGPQHRPLDASLQRPPAASNVSSPSLPINYSSLPKFPPSLASTSSYVSASASASDLCICTPYISADVPLVPVLNVFVITRPA